MKQNYQLILEQTIQKIQKEGKRPSLLLHSCCGPCSSYVMEYLAQHFEITVFYYNPNISPESEFRFRAAEQERLIQEMGFGVKYHLGKYDPERFFELAKGYENEPEGGERCFRCYRLRLEETAKAAKDGGFDYFTTTLSISPHKNAQVLNELGNELSDLYGVAYLFSDFKKKNGYRRSCELSIEYDLYRQDYCGCAFSKAEALLRNAQKSPKGE
ncbi:MAG: epoxyqueuosine reductase QueH [Bacillota bacterium]|nr:epoxyqueuosine reductase QueH [Bacillota bacterium]